MYTDDKFMSKLSPSQLEALISLLDDPDWEVKNHVREQLIALGVEVIPLLEQKWEESFNPVLQKELEDLVHELQFALVKERLKQWKESKEQDLLRGLWIINTYHYPDLEYESLHASVHQLYMQVWTSFRKDLHVYDQIKILNHVLYTQERYSPNTKNFHSPSNSMLSQVIETKKGNPISLCCLYLMVAQKLELPVYGVNLPNLFVLTYKNDDLTLYINAFNKGIIFTRQDIQNYLEQLKIDLREEYFEPCNSLAILQRFLRNLISSFEKLGEPEKVEEIQDLLSILMD